MARAPRWKWALLVAGLLGCDVEADGQHATAAHARPPSDRPLVPDCTDADGDGFGDGCIRGLDCDDRNARRNHGLPESCDDVDNDCDEHVDEGLGLGEPCEVLLLTCAVDGERWCVRGRARCVPYEPIVEHCNGRDDDCDDRVDERVPERDTDCETGLDGICGSGRHVCVDGAFSCEPRVAAGSREEVCNGADDDCDGAVDEAPAGAGALARACYQGAPETRGVGACRDGEQTCVTGQWSVCAGQSLPRAEACDGVDDDCDARTDEGCQE